MTKAQELTIKVIEDYMLNRMCNRNRNNRYEIKRKEVEEITENLVSLVIQTGLIDDDGTWASLLLRDTIHVFIGKKGGTFCYVTAKRGPNKGKSITYTDSWLGCCHRSMEDFSV